MTYQYGIIISYPSCFLWKFQISLIYQAVIGIINNSDNQVDDLHASLQSKAREVKELRNQLTMTNATGMELVSHITSFSSSSLLTADRSLNLAQ